MRKIIIVLALAYFAVRVIVPIKGPVHNPPRVAVG